MNHDWTPARRRYKELQTALDGALRLLRFIPAGDARADQLERVGLLQDQAAVAHIAVHRRGAVSDGLRRAADGSRRAAVAERARTTRKAA